MLLRCLLTSLIPLLQACPLLLLLLCQPPPNTECSSPPDVPPATTIITRPRWQRPLGSSCSCSCSSFRAQRAPQSGTARSSTAAATTAKRRCGSSARKGSTARSSANAGAPAASTAHGWRRVSPRATRRSRTSRCSARRCCGSVPWCAAAARPCAILRSRAITALGIAGRGSLRLRARRRRRRWM